MLTYCRAFLEPSEQQKSQDSFYYKPLLALYFNVARAEIQLYV